MHLREYPFEEEVLFLKFFNGCTTFIGTLETSRVEHLTFGEYFSFVTVLCDLSGGARY